MNANGHAIVGLVFVVSAKVIAPEVVGAQEFVFTLFGSLLPDIDHTRSTLGRFNPFARWMKHRGKTHTLIGSILLCMPFLVFGGLLPFGFVLLGCVSHLVGDKLYSWLPRKKPFAIRLW
jgi:membrane-bound metal-dependent hydrolase YbcI (DUF457 family)